ncbi:hypothetical protein AB833_14745 [Chromatiales bacterium (ex Bugula neritina AB1)]|nr:hypothetical protein AB833_14745 [Chromatiales bacterium (ex Bugula neritina AB1)]
MNSSSPDQSYARGVAYAVCAGIFLSLGGLIVRYIEAADAWLVLLYRSFAFFITLLVFMIIRDRGQTIQRFRSLRLSDIIVSLALAAGFIFYVLSLYETTVANTVLLLSTGPFLAALLAYLVLRERVSTVTWYAMLMAIAGIFVMVSGGLGTGDWLGIAYALIAVSAFAVMVVTLRRAGDRDMIAATAMAGLVTAVVCLFFVDDFEISRNDLVLSLLMGSVQVGLGFILITLASRTVPAAQVPLLALGETALAPLWVWLWVDEQPGFRALLGGAIIIVALLVQGLMGSGTHQQSLQDPGS